MASVRKSKISIISLKVLDEENVVNINRKHVKNQGQFVKGDFSIAENI